MQACGSSQKILYVQTTCDSDTILDTLDKYSKGLDKESVLCELGIAGANIVKLLDLGWTLTEQIPVGKNVVNHLTKRNGKKTKKSWDEIQVFVRK